VGDCPAGRVVAPLDLEVRRSLRQVLIPGWYIRYLVEVLQYPSSNFLGSSYAGFGGTSEVFLANASLADLAQ